MRPISIPEYIKVHAQLNEPIERTCWNIHNAYQILQKKIPVTIDGPRSWQGHQKQIKKYE